jgi:putative membrane protein
MIGSTRNDYDRVVHFAFGLCATYAAWESFRRNIRGSLLTLYWLCFWLTMWLSALYEIGEAYVLKLAPDAGVAFLATQGDVFDAQNDMAGAMLGSLLCLAAIAIARAGKRP